MTPADILIAMAVVIAATTAGYYLVELWHNAVDAFEQRKRDKELADRNAERLKKAKERA